MIKTRPWYDKRETFKTGVARKQSAPNFPKNKHFLPPWYPFALAATNYRLEQINDLPSKKNTSSNWTLTKSDIGGVWYFPSAANFSDNFCARSFAFSTALILLSGVAAFSSLSSFVGFGLSSFFLKSGKKTSPLDTMNELQQEKAGVNVSFCLT